VPLFADDPSAPFSIHRMATLGQAKFDKRIGEWFGPATAATVLR
jgi:cysteine protease ATG4